MKLPRAADRLELPRMVEHQREARVEFHRQGFDTTVCCIRLRQRPGLLFGVKKPRRPKHGPPDKDPHHIDGLSGATITSNGITRVVRFWLSADGYAPFLETLRRGAPS